MSITGMSSLIGYTRLHVAHLSAVPFFTSVTGVLQFGHARISSSSRSTGMVGIYDTFTLLWNNSRMKLAVLVAALSVSVPLAAEQARGQRQPPPATSDKIAEAYNQFLLGHRLEDKDDEAGAIAAYKRAMELDPLAADIPAELAGLYLRQNKVKEAMDAAEGAVKIAPLNREANRVLGTVYAALSEAAQQGQNGGRDRAANRSDDNLSKAIKYLEVAADKSAGEADPNVRATLARLYVRGGMFEKAIPLLAELVNQEPGWQDGPTMLVEAYAGAGRAKDAIAWLEQRTTDDPRLLPAPGNFYEPDPPWP